MKVKYRGVEMEGTPKEVFLLISLMGSNNPTYSHSENHQLVGGMVSDKRKRHWYSNTQTYHERGMNGLSSYCDVKC